MKKQLFAFIFAVGVAVVINAGQAHAQNLLTIRVDVPFAFTANDRPLPAGTYRISPLTDNRVVWRVLGEDPRVGSNALVLVNTLSSGTQSDKLRLTFHKYGDTSFLVGFNTPSYRVDLRPSRGEKALQRVGRKVAKATVTVIGTDGESH